MFNFLKKNKQKGESVTLKLSGLHCSSCSLTIDDSLEETPGVFSAKTSYAKQESVINFDPTKVNVKTLKQVIKSSGYQVIS